MTGIDWFKVGVWAAILVGLAAFWALVVLLVRAVLS